MPQPVSIAGRSSSISNSFANGIIPCIEPSKEEIHNALSVLGMKEDDVRCAYCGEPFSEWDHLNPLIINKEPTGYISEINNLVPACGKCNQSKGNKKWEEWFIGDSPRAQEIRQNNDYNDRKAKLKKYEKEFKPRRINFEELIGKKEWDEYKSARDKILDAMKNCQEKQNSIKKVVREKIKDNTITQITAT